jgi:hypothetical protein
MLQPYTVLPKADSQPVNLLLQGLFQQHHNQFIFTFHLLTTFSRWRTFCCSTICILLLRHCHRHLWHFHVTASVPCCCCCCRGRARSIITSSSAAAYSPSSAGGAAPPGATNSSAAATTILTGADWELDASSHTIRIVGGNSSSSEAKAAPSGSSTPSAAAAAGVVEVVDEYGEDVPPLDLAALRGQAVTPGNAGLLLQGEQRRCGHK